MFQHKILNNILVLNKLLFKFKKVPSPLCSFCNSGMKHRCISSIPVILQNDLKSLHRKPFSVFSILAIKTTEFFINQPFITTFQVLFLYIKRTWSCLFYQFEIILDKNQNNTTEYQSMQQPEKGKMLKKMESHCKHSEINKFSIKIFIVIFIFLSIKDLFLTLILPFFFVSGEKLSS